MVGLLFVNAPEATHKDINRVLLYIRCWDGEWSPFKLVTTRNAYDLDLPECAGEEQELDGTEAPVDEDIKNAWAGAQLTDIEAFCKDLQRNNVTSVNPELYIVVDSAGLHQKTCVLGMCIEEDYDSQTKVMSYSKYFRRFRLPWDETYLTWCNLDIHNMEFESFVAEEDIYERADRNTRIWWTYQSVSNEPDLCAEDQQRRDDEIERLQADGRI